jgi:GTP-binding protein
MFIDEIKIFARAGHGGKGCIAFHREAYITKGGPSGGNGGRGGNVILQADHDLNNLIAQYYTPRLIAEGGEGGMGKGMDGHAGKDLIIKVPCGTLVWLLEGGGVPEPEPEDDDDDDEKPVFKTSVSRRPLMRTSGGERGAEIDLTKDEQMPVKSGETGPRKLVADLTQNGQQYILCKAGRGGLGNRNFATARHQTPRFAQPGEAGEEGTYQLELRIMAEVALVGFPRPVRRWRRTRSPPSIRRSESWSTRISSALPSVTCPD